MKRWAKCSVLVLSLLVSLLMWTTPVLADEVIRADEDVVATETEQNDNRWLSALIPCSGATVALLCLAGVRRKKEKPHKK